MFDLQRGFLLRAGGLLDSREGGSAGIFAFDDGCERRTARILGTLGCEGPSLDEGTWRAR